MSIQHTTRNAFIYGIEHQGNGNTLIRFRDEDFETIGKFMKPTNECQSLKLDERITVQIASRISEEKPTDPEQFTEDDLQLIRKQHKRLPTTVQDVFYKNHKFARLLFSNSDDCLAYANRTTLEQTGVDLLAQEGIQPSKYRQVCEQFWQNYQTLVSMLGENAINHSANPIYIAIHLPSFQQLCIEHGLPVATAAIWHKNLVRSTKHKFVAYKPVSSRIFKNACKALVFLA